MIGLYKRPPAPMPVDTLICWFSWSDYYHASWIDWEGDKSEWESKPFHGVCHNQRWGQNAPKGSVIYLYDFNRPQTPEELKATLAYFESRKGKGYDYRGIFGFMARRAVANPDKDFCSELVFDGCEDGGKLLLQDREGFQVPPEGIAESTIIHCVGRLIVGDGDRLYPVLTEEGR